MSVLKGCLSIWVIEYIERSMLYAHGILVAVNRVGGSRGYLGTDIMGSTRSVTDSHGVQEGYYDYRNGYRLSFYS